MLVRRPAPTVLVLLALVGAPGCTETEATVGLQVEIALDAPRSPTATADGAREVETDRGFRVRLEHALLATHTVELEACAPEEGTAAALRRRVLAFELVPSAHAHEASSPTRLGDPYVESLLAPVGSEAEVGTLAPPPDRYCAVAWEAGPADDDAPGADDVPMVGKTLHVEGTWSEEGGEPQPFTLDRVDAIEARLAFASPLALGPEHPHAVVAVGKTLDHAFDGLDFAAGVRPDELEARVVENLVAALEIAVR